MLVSERMIHRGAACKYVDRWQGRMAARVLAGPCTCAPLWRRVCQPATPSRVDLSPRGSISWNDISSLQSRAATSARDGCINFLAEKTVRRVSSSLDPRCEHATYSRLYASRASAANLGKSPEKWGLSITGARCVARRKNDSCETTVCQIRIYTFAYTRTYVCMYIYIYWVKKMHNVEIRRMEETKNLSRFPFLYSRRKLSRGNYTVFLWF